MKTVQKERPEGLGKKTSKFRDEESEAQNENIFNQNVCVSGLVIDYYWHG
jgi:hypothetical protein